MVLPITVVVPTYNAMSLLPAHVAAMREWVPHVEDVVIVDSYSSDGTWDYLAEHVDGGNVRMLRHPPGLYESWNHGIAQSGSQYTYISTVGDVIGPNGLTALHETALSLQCDVVLSPPRLISGGGEYPDQGWPIHQIIEYYDVGSPLSLTTGCAVYFAMRYFPSSILGSSASNLYRTQCLQNSPFPCEFGHIGDSAWGVLNAARVNFAIHPEKVADFINHEHTRPRDKLTHARLIHDLNEMAWNQTREHFFGRQSPSVPADATDAFLPLVRDWINVGTRRCSLDFGLQEMRSEGLHWMLKPDAWSLRRKRNKKRLEESRLRRKLDNAVRSAMQNETA